MTNLTRRELAIRAASAALILGAAHDPLGADEVSASQHSADVLRNPLALVDPELIPALKEVVRTRNITAASQLRNPAPNPTPASDRWRKSLEPLPAPAPQAVERHIPGPPGAPEVRVIIIDPAPGEHHRAAYLHMHGGGWVSGSAALTPGLQRIAQSCACVVVSVDYRLAPETRFPGPLEDNYAALRWLYAHAEELGVDRQRIALGGESAGGYYAAMLAIAARDRGEIPIALQLLLHAALDDRTGSSRPVPPYIGHSFWTAESNRFGWASLLGMPAGSANVPAGAVPGRLKNLAGLAPAFIGVGALDLFVEEGIEYARRLIHAGVSVELHVVPGAYHGFDLFAPNAHVSQRFTQYWLGALQRALAM